MGEDVRECQRKDLEREEVSGMKLSSRSVPQTGEGG